jgi:hypothetical protein
MFAEPAINDFIFNIRWHLGKALTNVRNRVGDIGASHAQRGLGMSGVVIAAIFADVQKEFEEGIADALGELKRAIRTTKLDRHELRQAALQCLENFTIGCKAATGADRFRSLPSMGDYIDRRLREFDEVLRFKIRNSMLAFLTRKNQRFRTCQIQLTLSP